MNEENLKLEAIKKAYGEYWEQAQPNNNDGWCKFQHINNKIFQELKMESFSLFCKDAVRPKSLEGIEDNNGWIRIENESDIPDCVGQYFTFSKVDYSPYFRIDLFSGRLRNSFVNGKSCFTHYQPIIKPKLPIY